MHENSLGLIIFMFTLPERIKKLTPAVLHKSYRRIILILSQPVFTNTNLHDSQNLSQDNLLAFLNTHLLVRDRILSRYCCQDRVLDDVSSKTL